MTGAMKLVVVVLLALGTFACGGKKQPQTTTSQSKIEGTGGSTYGGASYGGNAYGGSKYGHH